MRRTLESIAPQLDRDDEHIVIGDGPLPEARQLCAGYEQCVYLETPHKTNQWGNAQRDLGIENAQGTHIMFCDDDDSLMSWALQTVKAAALSHPNAMFIFKVQVVNYKAIHYPYLWAERIMRKGNIMSCGVVVPNRPDLPKWSMSPNAYAADFYFAQVCAQFCEVKWREEVIARTKS